jgi:general secretion pathway protein G
MQRRKRGFSLIELMVVITIIAMLAGGVALYLFGALDEARTARAKADIADLGKALSLYRMKAGKYPEALDELAQPLEGMKKGFVEDAVPQDPWGNDYFYQRTDDGYVLKSLGADGQEGGEGENADIDNKTKKEDE